MVGYGFATVRSSLRNATMSISEARTGRVMFKTILRVCSAVSALKRKMFKNQGVSK
jgi:hypothetical protein